MLQAQTRPDKVTTYGGNMRKAIKVTSLKVTGPTDFTCEAYYGYYDENNNFKWTTHATADGSFKMIKVAGEIKCLVTTLAMDDEGLLSPYHVEMYDLENKLDEQLLS